MTLDDPRSMTQAAPCVNGTPIADSLGLWRAIVDLMRHYCIEGHEREIMHAFRFAVFAAAVALSGTGCKGGSKEAGADPAKEPPVSSGVSSAVSIPEASSSSSSGIGASIYDLDVRTLEGAPAPLATYRGKVALIVNVASECGYTPQYAGLESLYEELAPRGFVILAFPSNDFGEQEPGAPAEIAKFAASTYHVTFPLFEKVKTSGDSVSPVYAIAANVDGPPKWNFHKYVVDRSGHVVRAFPSNVKPESDELRAAIVSALDAK